jgi:hypothetical protein
MLGSSTTGSNINGLDIVSLWKHASLCVTEYLQTSSHTDVWDIPDYVRAVDNQVFASKLNMAQQMLYNPILGIVKASIILFLLRLGDRRWFIRYGLIAFFIFK